MKATDVPTPRNHAPERKKVNGGGGWLSALILIGLVVAGIEVVRKSVLCEAESSNAERQRSDTNSRAEI